MGVRLDVIFSLDLWDRRVSCIGPGSFIEVTKMLGLLTEAGPGHPCFHVIAPSLPGYAWSKGFRNEDFVQGTTQRWAYCLNSLVDSHLQIWKLLNKLMISLGYTEYVTQGGDWGYFVRGCAFLHVAETDYGIFV